jgi:hypothetical protein
MDFILDYRAGRSLFTFWSIIIITLFVIYQLVLFFFPFILSNICIFIHFVQIFFKKMFVIFNLVKKINFFYKILNFISKCLRGFIFLPLRLNIYRENFILFCKNNVQVFRNLCIHSKKAPKRVKLTKKIQFPLNDIKTVDEREIIYLDKNQKFRLTNTSEGFFLFNEIIYPDRLKLKSQSVKIRKWYK